MLKSIRGFKVIGDKNQYKGAAIVAGKDNFGSYQMWVNTPELFKSKKAALNAIHEFAASVAACEYLAVTIGDNWEG